MTAIYASEVASTRKLLKHQVKYEIFRRFGSEFLGACRFHFV